MTTLRRWLGRHAGRGRHSPRRVAARRHPAGRRLALVNAAGDRFPIPGSYSVWEVAG